MYEEQCVPTVVSLKRRLTNEQTNISCYISSRRKILLKMRLRKWRLKYLTTVKQCGVENRPTNDLDEICFDTLKKDEHIF